jgi:Fe-S cluster assembly protein SufD
VGTTGSAPGQRSEVGTAPLTDRAAATARLLEAHRAFTGNGAGAAPVWLRDVRTAGLARFAELGFPTTNLEEWRFTSVAPIVATVFAAPPGETVPGPSASDAAAHLLEGAGRHRIVFVNGRFAPALSVLDGLPEGVTVASVATLLKSEPERLRALLDSAAANPQTAFAALNAAFLADGAFVHVRSGVEAVEPLQVLYLVTAGAEPVMTHPRTLVVAESQARVTVVESYAGTAGTVYWTNAVTDVVVGDGARADVLRVQRESERAFHVAATQTRQGRDSVVRLHPLVFGAALARHDITTVLDGEGSSCLLNGLYLGRGTQHLDHHTVIDHAKPHAESHEYFNGVLDERSRGVFNGRIVVRPGAQRTDSKQTNNNLLLSEEARADSQPQLEIYADDVRCTHGATLGPIDEKALFYLKSRGLGAEEARAMLTYGFGAEILGRIELPALRGHLQGLVRARLLGGSAAA